MDVDLAKSASDSRVKVEIKHEYDINATIKREPGVGIKQEADVIKQEQDTIVKTEAGAVVQSQVQAQAPVTVRIKRQRDQDQDQEQEPSHKRQTLPPTASVKRQRDQDQEQEPSPKRQALDPITVAAKTIQPPKKRERDMVVDDKIIMDKLDADITTVEEDIRTNAREYQECRKIMAMGVISIKATEQTAKMSTLLAKLREMKNTRKEAIQKRDAHMLALFAGDEKALVLEDVREKRAKRRRLYPRDKEKLTEEEETTMTLEKKKAQKVLVRSNSANCPGKCLNVVDDIRECVSVCLDCGHIYEDLTCNSENPLSTAPKFGEQVDAPRRRSGGYKPPIHMAEIVGHFQGNRSSLTPVDIMERIKWYCKRYYYKDHEITPQVARFFLRRMQQDENNRHANAKHKNPDDKLRRFTDYYKHAPEISYRLSGIPPPYMTPMQEDRVMSLFPYIVAAYKTCPRFKIRLQKKREEPKEKQDGKPEKMPNNPNYLLVFYKECQLFGYDEFLPYIPLPKNTDNIDDNDEYMWKHVCKLYNWLYLPTSASIHLSFFISLFIRINYKG